MIGNAPNNIEEAYLMIDRIKIDFENEEDSRISDSISLAFSEGNGNCFLYFPEDSSFHKFSTLFELHGM